jgi:hypothetical protein
MKEIIGNSVYVDGIEKVRLIALRGGVYHTERTADCLVGEWLDILLWLRENDYPAV